MTENMNKVLNLSESIRAWIDAAGRNARLATKEIAQASTGTKNAALEAMAQRISSDAQNILAANAKDLDAAHASGLSSALLDRL